MVSFFMGTLFQGIFPPGQSATIGVDFMIKTVRVGEDKVKVSTMELTFLVVNRWFQDLISLEFKGSSTVVSSAKNVCSCKSGIRRAKSDFVR